MGGGLDEIVDFGSVKLGYGRAFSIDGDASNVLEGRLDRANEIQVGKRIEEVGGRKILIETLPVDQLREVLSDGLRAQANSSEGPGKARLFAQRWVPDLPLLIDAPSEGIQIAQVPYTPEGFVIDYVVTSSTSNLTFQSGETYLLGFVRASGHTVIEAGAVLKFENYGGLVLELYDSGDSLTCPSSGIAYLTTRDDNTVGEVISGSTGAAAEVRTTVPLSLQVNHGNHLVRNLVVRHAINAVVANSTRPIDMENCRFEDCYRIAVLLGVWSIYGRDIVACNVDTVTKSFWGASLRLLTPLIEDCSNATVTSRPNLSYTQYSYYQYGIRPSIDSSQATIHYTTDGSLPTQLSPVMLPGVEQYFNETTLVRARGFELGKRPSRVASEMVVVSKLWDEGLGEAVDLGGLEFTTDGYDRTPWDDENHLLWTPQKSPSLFGASAAMSGRTNYDLLYYTGYAGMSTLRSQITGPGTLSFHWMVSAEHDYEWLEFNGGEGPRRVLWGGETDWEQEVVRIPAGVNYLDWTFRTDAYDRLGASRSWVDNVQYFPDSGGGILGSLAEAVDAPEMTFRSSGDWPWYINHDRYLTYPACAGGGSTAIRASGQSALESTVTGPGIIKFSWRQGADGGYPGASRFFIDSSERSVLYGQTGWQEMSFYVPSGSHDLKWSFQQWYGSFGAYVWLDRVSFTPSGSGGGGGLTLEEALDTSDLVFSTGGNGSWQPQTYNTYSGGDAA